MKPQFSGAKPFLLNGKKTLNTPTAPKVTNAHDCEAPSQVPLSTTTDLPDKQNAVAPASKKVDRGITSVIPAAVLAERIYLDALVTLNRLRVIRTIDIAIVCAPERRFKAALSAAQRTMGKLVKSRLVRRYVTNRGQHIYGLTTAGVNFLYEHGVEAAPSIRRVSEMTNPEHQLWMNFLVLACAVRGLKALTEAELLRQINNGIRDSKALNQGLLKIGKGRGARLLRPDAVAIEPDGVTWFEVDRSERGKSRLDHLMTLTDLVGMPLPLLAAEAGHANAAPRLQRLVIFARYDFIHRRNLARMRKKLKNSNREILVPDRGSHFRELDNDTFEVIAAVYLNQTSAAVDRVVGYVIFQMLPAWLPNVRQEEGEEPVEFGWFDGNYLPYRRPTALGQWTSPISPYL